MCNLYSIRRPRDEVIGLFGISHVNDGVQLELPAVYPDTMAPIIRLDDNGTRNLTMMRWGFPSPPKGGPRPVTNVRNTKSSCWRNIEAWRQLKRLAIDQDKPVSELQCEAINLLFATHGLPQIAVRWTPED